MTTISPDEPLRPMPVESPEDPVEPDTEPETEPATGNTGLETLEEDQLIERHEGVRERDDHPTPDDVEISD